MLRARLLVERCYAEGLIAPTRPLLVIGGGVAGAVATMVAATLRIPVVLLEQQADLFTRQLLSTRHLDPTEYDWPARHWREGKFPWHTSRPSHAGPVMPLPYWTASAQHLGIAWQRLVSLWEGQSPGNTFATIIRGCHFTKTMLRRSAKQKDWLFLHHNIAQLPPNPVAFGAAISCVGFPHEKRFVPAAPVPGKKQYAGFEFWGDDPLLLPNCGVPVASSPLRVLISGAGDGALQDFLRVLTGGNAKALYDALFSKVGLQHFIPYYRPPGYRFLPFAQTEDEAHRACSFAAKDGHWTLDQWHSAYVTEIDRIWTFWGPKEQQRLAQVLRPNVEVTLVHPCRHFGFCYGLNRVLVLLVTRLHAQQSGRPVAEILQSGHEVDAVDGANHSCGDPWVCHGKPHEVWIRSADCFASSSSSQLLGTFQSVIIRHGATPQPLFGTAALPRQVVPYHDLF